MSDALTIVRETAPAHGFDVVGVTSAEPLQEALEALEAWWAGGHGAAMRWMGRRPPERADPRTLLDAVRSVVTVAVDYWTPAPPFVAERRFGRVARYAWGRDYHDVVLERLRDLARDLVRRLDGAERFACACDHSPLLERALAARAGLGAFGKNTCLLLPRCGSYTFLGEVLLDVDLPPTPPSPAPPCGTCTRCLDACPTDALTAPFVLDARRCVSYLTIEHPGPIPRALRPRLGAWLFGCDDCQEVCPANRFASPTSWPDLRPEAGVGPRLDLVETLSLATDEAFRARFAATPLLRPKRRGLLRNAAVVARNVGAHVAVPALVTRVEHDEEPLIRAHALWALGGLDAPRTRDLAEAVFRADPDPLVREEAEAVLEGE